MTTKSKRRFNMISESSDGIGFAIRLKDEGEDVRVWIRDPAAKSVGDGLVTKVGDLEDLVHGADPDNDIFIFDVSGNGILADYLRQNKFPVLGGSMLADRLERDRSFGVDVMKECGINVPPTHSFTSFSDGIAFAEAHSEARWVYKPSKSLGDLSPSHVSFDTEDLIEMLHNIEAEVDIADPQFELQEFRKGATLSTELWFQDGEFLPLTNHTFERKELMNDDLGPSGGCTGNIVWMCDGCRLCDEAKKLVPWLERNRYSGPIDLNVIAGEDGGIYGLEFTPRFGYDATPTFLLELLESPLADFFEDIARNRLRQFEISDKQFAAALRVTIPPWPTEKHHAEENIPLRGLPSTRNHVYFYNVKQNESGLASAGAWGILLLLLGKGDTVGKAFSSPNKWAKELKIKNRQYRTDLVKAFEEDLAKLEEFKAIEVA